MVVIADKKCAIKGIVFDLYGIWVIDSYKEALEWEAKKYRKYWKDFSRSINSLNGNDIWWKFATGRITEKEYWKKMVEITKSTRMVTELRGKVYGLMIIKKKTVEIIKKLKDNFKLGLLTNNTKEWMDFLKSKKDGKEALQLFDVVINSADVSVKKPDKRFYEIMVKRLQLQPEEILFIDDTERNTKVAESLGMDVIIFESVRQLRGNLAKRGIKL